MGKFKDGFNVAVKYGLEAISHPSKIGECRRKMIEEGEEIEKKYEKDKREKN